MNRFYHWLKSDQKYSEGVNLYVLHGQNEALKKMLLRGESPFGRRKLVQEITALSKGKVKVKEVAIVPPKPIPQSDLPKEVQQLHKLKIFHYKEMGRHRKDLFSHDKEVRKEAAFKILEHRKVNMECWSKLDYYNKHGALPSNELNVVGIKYLQSLSDGNLIKLRNNNRSYISKNKKRLKDLKPERNERIEREINRRVLENKKIQTILDGQTI
jgi:hypothetical protein